MREIIYYLAHLLAIVGVPFMIYGILVLQTDRFNRRKRGDDR